MFKIIYSHFQIILFFAVFSFQIAYADNDSSKDSGEESQSFPFDKPCLTYDKANFTVGPALLAVMKENDFPQYCVLYSLSDYQVKQKLEGGYLIMGSTLEPKRAEVTEVFLKSDKLYQQNQTFTGHGAGVSKPEGQWAYFKGPEEFFPKNGLEKEIYVFQEIDF
jgi:hypothetical protein